MRKKYDRKRVSNQSGYLTFEMERKKKCYIEDQAIIDQYERYSLNTYRKHANDFF